MSENLKNVKLAVLLFAGAFIFSGCAESVPTSTPQQISQSECDAIFSSAPHIYDIYPYLKLNSEEEENDKSTGLHNQGFDCLSCHYSGGPGEKVFTIGGTIFRKKDAPDKDVASAAEGYTVQLVLRNCQTVTANKGRGSGNFYMNFSPSEDFIPFVIDPSGNRVNRSAAVHPKDRLRCNSCHTQSGVNGAPGRIVSFDFYGKL